MLVREYMNATPIAVSPETSCSHTFRLMQKTGIDKLPVLSDEGALAGIVTQKDLLYALPTSLALLSISEIDELFGGMSVVRVMTRRVISISEDCPLEEAARILLVNKISTLPVTHDHRFVGMITKDDIFGAMMESLGGIAAGLRITIRLGEDTGELGAITDGIVNLGGTLINLSTHWGGDASHKTVTLKVQGMDRQELISFVEKNIGVEVIDYHESGAEYPSQRVLLPKTQAAFPFRELDPEYSFSTDSK